MVRKLHCDVLIVGGGLGGVSAALTAARLGRSVIVTEETDWLGGQATTQGVPLDEHPWIEQYGSSQSYRRFRREVRRYYRECYPLTAASRADPHFNPGAGWVSALGFEPRVGSAVLDRLLAPHRSAARVRVLTRARPIAARTQGDAVESVTFGGENDEDWEVTAAYVLDATELGDVLELAGVEHVIGAESQSQTGEPSALEGDPDPLKQQGFTHLVAVDYQPGEDHTIAEPPDYDTYRTRFQGLHGVLPSEGDPISVRMQRLFAPEMLGPVGDLQAASPYHPCIWNFRRVLCRDNFARGAFSSDITMLMNGNELSGRPLVGVSAEEVEANREAARNLTLSLVYFLQTEIEPGYSRANGGIGFPGIRPRGDVFGTSNGLAAFPYIRESRRIAAEFTAVEQHFRRDVPGNERGPVLYADSVGVGGYRIDIHEPGKSKRSRTKELHGNAWPQQIALGSLVPIRVENIIPSCKNIGATHITNGCYRLHPTEWIIGEAAGALAAFCLDYATTPRAVSADEARTADFQRRLERLGVELEWPGMDYARSYNSHYVTVPDWYWGETSQFDSSTTPRIQ